MDGLILINKEKDWTSRDVCNVIQRIYSTKKVGHTGTLDPFAEGLLLVTINRANKIAQFLDDFTKTYVATIKLGQKTNTLDLTGEVIETKEVPILKEEKIIEVLNSFKGKIKQVPPMTSAIHYKGRKLYEYYHEGIEVERETRDVEIFNISLLSFEEDEIIFEAEVSKGTYIRVLGEDIASKLGTVGHLSFLRRTKIGPFDIKDSIEISALTSDYIPLSIRETLNFMETYVVEDDMIKKVKDGVKLNIENIKGDLALIVSKDGEPISIYERKLDNIFTCKRGIWA